MSIKFAQVIAERMPTNPLLSSDKSEDFLPLRKVENLLRQKDVVYCLQKKAVLDTVKTPSRLKF